MLIKCCYLSFDTGVWNSLCIVGGVGGIGAGGWVEDLNLFHSWNCYSWNCSNINDLKYVRKYVKDGFLLFTTKPGNILNILQYPKSYPLEHSRRSILLQAVINSDLQLQWFSLDWFSWIPSSRFLNKFKHVSLYWETTKYIYIFFWIIPPPSLVHPHNTTYRCHSFSDVKTNIDTFAKTNKNFITVIFTLAKLDFFRCISYMPTKWLNWDT